MEVSRSILTPLYPEGVLAGCVRFSGVIRQPAGFDPVSREYDTTVVTDSPEQKKYIYLKLKLKRIYVISLFCESSSFLDVIPQIIRPL